MKRGLVLEGGAMRGLFTAGVIDVLMENGIVFDGMVGVSAGAAFGCNVKSGQIGRVLRYNTRFCKDARYCSLRSLLRTGDLYGADFCYHELPEKLDVFDTAAFEHNPMEFWAVCTDVETGKAEYRRCDRGDYDDLEWIRASASMPLVSRVVETDGKRLLDGGIADSIPLRFFEKQGYTKNLVVLTQPQGYVKKTSRALPLMKLFLRKMPKVYEAMRRRADVYNEQIAFVEAEERAGNALVIRPKAKLPVGRIEHDAEKLREAYRLGREAAEEKLDAIRAFLK